MDTTIIGKLKKSKHLDKFIEHVQHCEKLTKLMDEKTKEIADLKKTRAQIDDVLFKMIEGEVEIDDDITMNTKKGSITFKKAKITKKATRQQILDITYTYLCDKKYIKQEDIDIINPDINELIDEEEQKTLQVKNKVILKNKK